MANASTILGGQVGSTAPVFLAFLAIHVPAGLTAVATGATAALTRKGSRRHIRAGRWYYRAICVVFATAAALAIMRWRQDYYLLIIGAVAFTAATTGYLHRRQHRPGDTGHIAGMGISYVAMLTAFYVDNGPHLPLWDHLPRLGLWLLPAAIGTPIIARAILAARKRTGKPKQLWLTSVTRKLFLGTCRSRSLSPDQSPPEAMISGGEHGDRTSDRASTGRRQWTSAHSATVPQVTHRRSARHGRRPTPR